MNKSFCVIFLVVAAAALAVAYNFEDPNFNELLARDLDDYYLDSHVSLGRARRDEDAQKGCRKRPIKTCCAEETLEQLHEKDRDIKRECFRQVTGKDRDAKYLHRDPFRCDNIEKHRRDMTGGDGAEAERLINEDLDKFLAWTNKHCSKINPIKSSVLLFCGKSGHQYLEQKLLEMPSLMSMDQCVMECVVKKKNLVESDGKVKQDVLRAHLNEEFKKETWLSPMLDKIVSKCLDEALNATTTPGSGSDADSAPCNPAGMRMARCLYKEIQMSCPADQIKDEKACARIRDRIKRNEEFFPPHPQPQMDDDN